MCHHYEKRKCIHILMKVMCSRKRGRHYNKIEECGNFVVKVVM